MIDMSNVIKWRQFGMIDKWIIEDPAAVSPIQSAQHTLRVKGRRNSVIYWGRCLDSELYNYPASHPLPSSLDPHIPLLRHFTDWHMWKVSITQRADLSSLFYCLRLSVFLSESVQFGSLNGGAKTCNENDHDSNIWIFKLMNQLISG